MAPGSNRATGQELSVRDVQLKSPHSRSWTIQERMARSDKAAGAHGDGGPAQPCETGSLSVPSLLCELLTRL